MKPLKATRSVAGVTRDGDLPLAGTGQPSSAQGRPERSYEHDPRVCGCLLCEPARRAYWEPRVWPAVFARMIDISQWYLRKS